MIAVYTRSAGLEDHIRLDFLDVPETPSADIFIALDTQPGGAEMAHLSRLDLEALYPEGLVETDIAYDLLLVIPAEGEPGVIDVAEVNSLDPPQSPHRPRPRARHADRGLQPLRPAGELLPAGLRHPRRGARSRRPGLSPFHRTLIPIAARHLLMAFSDVFDATTPAQTLRRWDGAHTGPYGERHGLHPLLDAAAANRHSARLAGSQDTCQSSPRST